MLTAVTDARWEADLVAAWSRGELGVVVVRRCVDLADLLAAAATGQARAVLLSADLRRLDRDALTRLAVADVAVVALVPSDDEQAAERLRGLGVPQVLPADASPDVVAAAVLDAVHRGVPPTPGEQLSWSGTPLPHARAPGGGDGLGDPEIGLGADRADPGGTVGEAGKGADGTVVAVWGPTGAPGRTTVAVGLAGELSALGRATLLVDADVYGGVVAQLLGLLDEAPGLAAACRLANGGTLGPAQLAGLARGLGDHLRVLPGIARADRWPELRPAAVETVLGLARSLAEVTLVDCGFALELDEELVYDTAAPRRNGATLTVLEQADAVLAVGSADPVGLQRLVRGLAELREVAPAVTPRVVVNRLRATAVPGDAEREVRRALARFAGVEDVHVVPADVPGVDAAVVAGRTLAEASPGSPARVALSQLAAELVGAPPPRPRRRLLRRR